MWIPNQSFEKPKTKEVTTNMSNKSPKSSFIHGETKRALFARISANTIDGTAVSVWEVVRKGQLLGGDGYYFTATIDRRGLPVPPAADAHRSFDKKWALDYLRRQIKRGGR